MNNKTVLCEIAFLEKFLECYPDSPPFPDEKVQLKLRGIRILPTFGKNQRKERQDWISRTVLMI